MDRQALMKTEVGRRCVPHIMQSGVHAQNGQWKLALVEYRAAVVKSNDHPSFILRSFALSGWTAILQDQCIRQTTPADLKLLKGIAAGKYNDILIVRVIAMYARGILCQDLGDRDTAAIYYRKTLALHATATAQDKNALMWAGGGRPVAAGGNFQKIFENTTGNLLDLEGKPSSTPTQNDRIAEEESFLKSIGVADEHMEHWKKLSAVNTPVPASTLTSCPVEYIELIKTNVKVGGTTCTVCGKTPESADAPLSKCGKCKSRWYCNKDCQRKDYRNKHKANCRPSKGPYKTNDLCLLKGLQNATDLNWQMVKVMRLSPTNHSRWEVVLVMNGKKINVKAANLKFLHPL